MYIMVKVHNMLFMIRISYKKKFQWYKNEENSRLNSTVLYVSTHRYEYGKFWPHLVESDFDHIGEGNGQGYNINIPLNKV